MPMQVQKLTIVNEKMALSGSEIQKMTPMI